LEAFLSWNGQINVIPNGILPDEMTVPFNMEQKLVIDSSLIRDELGFIEPITFRDGLIATIEWELANQPSATFDYSKEDEILREFGRAI
jgi:nucleoside-diphosphate-sugar epimerase